MYTSLASAVEASDHVAALRMDDELQPQSLAARSRTRTVQ